MPPPPVYQPPATYQAGAVASPQTNQKAVISLVLGIVSCVCCAICGPIAIYLANQARAEIRNSGGAEGGEGIAQGGLITGIIGTIFLGIAILYFVFVVLAIGRAATTGG